MGLELGGGGGSPVLLPSPDPSLLPLPPPPPLHAAPSFSFSVLSAPTLLLWTASPLTLLNPFLRASSPPSPPSPPGLQLRGRAGAVAASEPPQVRDAQRRGHQVHQHRLPHRALRGAHALPRAHWLLGRRRGRASSRVGTPSPISRPGTAPSPPGLLTTGRPSTPSGTHAGLPLTPHQSLFLPFLPSSPPSPSPLTSPPSPPLPTSPPPPSTLSLSVCLSVCLSLSLSLSLPLPPLPAHPSVPSFPPFALSLPLSRPVPSFPPILWSSPV